MRKYIPSVIIGILFIAIVFQCTHNSSLENENAVQGQKVKDNERIISDYKSHVDFLESGKEEMQTTIDSLNLQITQAKKLLEQIKNEKDENIKIVNRYSVSDMQQYYNERYRAGK